MEIHQRASHSCKACASGKRKCDRLKPICSYCSRVGRACNYDEDFPHHQDPNVMPYGVTGTGCGSKFDHTLEIDGFQHESTREHTVNAMIAMELHRFVGTLDHMRKASESFFIGTHVRFPIMSKTGFYRELDQQAVTSSADFTALCIAIALIQQRPRQPDVSMVTSLYVSMKSIISLLEATSQPTLRSIQARALVCLYELGHGLHKAAVISVAAAAKAARILGIHRHRELGQIRDIAQEEQRRTWWAVFDLDRNINLHIGDASFSAEAPRPSDPLPYGDEIFINEASPLVRAAGNVSSPIDEGIGQFARESQVSHLAGQTLRHMFDPTSDEEFQTQEALQLERTLQSFLPVLDAHQLTYGRYCASLAICSSTLLTFYEQRSKCASTDTTAALSAMQEAADGINFYAKRCYGPDGVVDEATFSPYVPLSLYQSAVIQLRLWQQKANPRHLEAFSNLQVILGYFGRRWAVANEYLQALKAETPVLLPRL